MRTVDEALQRFDLIAGAGAESDNTACVMTLLAWVAGEAWTDHPPCAHRTLADIVINANDSDTATPKSRASLVKAGQEGVLDTWWIPGVVIAWAMSRAKDAKPMTAHQYAMYVLKRIAKWKAGLRSEISARQYQLDRSNGDVCE